MTKRNGFLIFAALVLAGVYAVYFTNWFKPKIIQITGFNARVTQNSRFRNFRPGLPGSFSRFNRFPNLNNLNANSDAGLAVNPVTFRLERPYKLTELKVVMLDEWQTNKNCLPLWHLVADTNSVPVSGFFNYGQPIRGMKTEVPGAKPLPLKPGVKYRMFITDGSATGRIDFQPLALPVTAQPALVGR
jgi:hypothetical protein